MCESTICFRGTKKRNCKVLAIKGNQNERHMILHLYDNYGIRRDRFNLKVEKIVLWPEKIGHRFTRKFTYASFLAQWSDRMFT